MRFGLLSLLFCVPITSFGFSSAPPTENSHSAMRLTPFLGVQSGGQAFSSLEYRFALHDFTDLQLGYAPSTRLDLLQFRFRIPWQSPRFFLEELTVVRVQRLPPLTLESDELSWSFDMGAETVRDKNCDECIAMHLRGGIGLTLEALESAFFQTFVLMECEASVSSRYPQWKLKPGFGPRMGVRLRPTDNWAIFLEGSYRYLTLSDFPHRYRLDLDQRWALSTNWALQVRASRIQEVWETGVGLSSYF